MYAATSLTTNRDGEMRRAVRAAAIITALSCTSAWADNPTLLEKYKEWSAFAASGTPKVCFALAQPKQSTPKGIKRGPIYFYISQWPADGVTNEVSVKMGYPFGPGAKATATVGGAKHAIIGTFCHVGIRRATASIWNIRRT